MRRRRLTWRYADRAAHVTAIDPFEDAIERAKERLRSTHLPIDFRHVAFEDFAPPATPTCSTWGCSPGRSAEWSRRAWSMPLSRSTGC